MAVLEGGLDAWESAGYRTVGGAPPDQVDGMQLYARHCATCHQVDGRGLPGHYPPLVGSGIATMSDSRALILVTLEGLRPAATPTRPRPAHMPGFAASLTDQEVAAILTHVRTSWGNDAGAVEPAEVRAMREKGSFTEGQSKGGVFWFSLPLALAARQTQSGDVE